MSAGQHIMPIHHETQPASVLPSGRRADLRSRFQWLKHIVSGWHERNEPPPVNQFGCRRPHAPIEVTVSLGCFDHERFWWLDRAALSLRDEALQVSRWLVGER